MTAAGEEALQAWLTSGAPLHFELRHEGVLRFFLSDAIDVEERIELLRSIRSEHERVLSELRSIRSGAEDDCATRQVEMPLMTLDFGVAYQRFIVEWCEELERRLDAASTTAAARSG